MQDMTFPQVQQAFSGMASALSVQRISFIYAYCTVLYIGSVDGRFPMVHSIKRPEAFRLL